MNSAVAEAVENRNVIRDPPPLKLPSPDPLPEAEGELLLPLAQGSEPSSLILGWYRLGPMGRQMNKQQCHGVKMLPMS